MKNILFTWVISLEIRWYLVFVRYKIIKEIVEMILEKDLLLANSDNIKFLNSIIPGKFPVLQVRLRIKDMESSGWDVAGNISKEDLIFLKFKGIFRLQ